MNDPLVGKYKRLYKDEFNLARKVLKDMPGKLEWSTNDYQAFTYKEEKVRLVFYPHKTSANHHHIRVRNEGSKDKERANELIRLLDGSTIGCTFYAKAKPN